MKSSVIAFLSAFISIAHFAQCQNSVLSEGNWYKLAVEQTGIYRIDYNDLVSYGIDPTQINPVNIRLYGNGSGMLPEDPDAFRYDDLQENAIFVFGEEDETFDPGDYILFYGEAPTEWALNSATGFFEHQVNLYSDYTFYFLNFDLGQGKRIQDQYSTIIPPNYLCTSFDDHFYHEAELENLIHSGKKWYGERFEDVTQHSFPVSFSELVQDEQVYMKVSAAARSYITSNLILSIDNQDMLTLSFSPVSGSSLSSDFAKYRIDTLLFYAGQSNFTVKLTYDKPMDSSIAWLDYLTLNARRKLAYENGQLSFRDKESAGSGKVTTFQITTSNSNFELWNITDPLNPAYVHYLSTDTTAIFTLETDSLLEFIAFDANTYISPLFIGETENQNLHGLNPVDLIIITDDDFKPSAQQLASFRENHDGLSTFVTTPGKIYNEFSSGTKDITAIRDFIKFIVQ